MAEYIQLSFHMHILFLFRFFIKFTFFNIYLIYMFFESSSQIFTSFVFSSPFHSQILCAIFRLHRFSLFALEFHILCVILLFLHFNILCLPSKSLKSEQSLCFVEGQKKCGKMLIFNKHIYLKVKKRNRKSGCSEKRRCGRKF